MVVESGLRWDVEVRIGEAPEKNAAAFRLERHRGFADAKSSRCGLHVPLRVKIIPTPTKIMK